MARLGSREREQNTGTESPCPWQVPVFSLILSLSLSVFLVSGPVTPPQYEQLPAQCPLTAIIPPPPPPPWHAIHPQQSYKRVRLNETPGGIFPPHVPISQESEFKRGWHPRGGFFVGWLDRPLCSRMPDPSGWWGEGLLERATVTVCRTH